MPKIPDLTATTIPSGWALHRGPMLLGNVFRVNAGWVITGHAGSRHRWRRSLPRPTAAAAAHARWSIGKAEFATAVLHACETSVAA